MRLTISWGVLLLLVPSLAFGWWNDDWQYRKPLTFDTTASGAALATDVESASVLLRLSFANFAYFTDVLPGGDDFRVIAGDDQTPLKYHVERVDTSAGLGFLWVKLPRLAGNANSEKIWLYYGNSEAEAGSDPAGSFDVDQALVYHFDSIAGAPLDATAYGNNPQSSDAELTTASLIGGGARFAGEQSIVVPPSPSLRLQPDLGWSFSSWIKLDEDSATPATLMLFADESASLALESSNGQLEAIVTTAEGEQRSGGQGSLAAGSWHHVAVVVSEGRLALYVDGQAAGGLDLPLTFSVTGSLQIGGATGRVGLSGEMDEVRVSKTARSQAWIQLAVKSQGFDPTMIAYGEDEGEGSSDGGSDSYFIRVLGYVTTDGQVVIAILGMMAALSWAVMIMKSFVLNRTRVADQKFMHEFKRLRPDDATRLDSAEIDQDAEIDDDPFLLALFGKGGEYRNSSLFHIYHAGVQDLNRRREAARRFTRHSVDAFRASLDAALVRELQKANSQMVLLTISISGGPFLGLLGTVVGVMATFAEVALSGEVDVNAIAPGVAGALMTTVAGLVVAIPALFGYNYLAIRIRDMTADMNVFVDEMVATVAEYYVVSEE